MSKKRFDWISTILFHHEEYYSLEHRLFLSSLLVGLLITIIGLIVAMAVSANIISIIVCWVFIFMLLLVYYFSRFKKILEPFIIPVIIISYIGVFIIWVFGGGVNSQNIVPAMVALIFSLIIGPLKKRKYLFFIFISLVAIVYSLQYFRPDLILAYPTESYRVIDGFAITVYSSFCLYLVIGFFHKHYRFEKKRAEESEHKLKLLNDDKDKFIAILAHDLKGPFNSLLGFSDLLVKNYKEFDSAKTERILNIIHQTSYQTFYLLEDLLLWSKSNAGKLQIEPQKISVYESCADLLLILKANANFKNISIHCEEKEYSAVLADYNMYKTILRNLISNAIKFTQPGGRIDIYTKQNEEFMMIVVADNGIGMGKEQLEKIWDFKSETYRIGTSGEEGSGLGLVLCKEFVELNGGKIWVESEVGVGSKFIFTLPLFKD